MARYCRITATTLEKTASGLLLVANDVGIELPILVGLRIIPDLGTETHGFGAFTDAGWDFRLVPRGQDAPLPPDDGSDWKPAAGMQFLIEDYGLWPLTSNIALGVSFIQALGQKVRHLPEAQEGRNPICRVAPALAVPIVVPGSKVKKNFFKPHCPYTGEWEEERPEEVYGARTVFPNADDVDPLKVLTAPSVRGPGLIIANEQFANARKAIAPIQPRFPIPPPAKIEDDEIRF